MKATRVASEMIPPSHARLPETFSELPALRAKKNFRIFPGSAGKRARGGCRPPFWGIDKKTKHIK